MVTNNDQNIFKEWFFWYFYEMPKFLLEVWKNYFLFGLNYFSVLILLKSLFAPWRRYRWIYPKGINVVEFFNTLISNIVSRILGFLMRIILILAGISFQIFVIFAGLVIFLSWVLIPLIAIAGFFFVLTY